MSLNTLVQTSCLDPAYPMHQSARTSPCPNSDHAFSYSLRYSLYRLLSLSQRDKFNQELSSVLDSWAILVDALTNLFRNISLLSWRLISQSLRGIT